MLIGSGPGPGAGNGPGLPRPWEPRGQAEEAQPEAKECKSSSPDLAQPSRASGRVSRLKSLLSSSVTAAHGHGDHASLLVLFRGTELPGPLGRPQGLSLRTQPWLSQGSFALQVQFLEG